MTATVHSVMLAQSHSFNYCTLKETVYSVAEFFIIITEQQMRNISTQSTSVIRLSDMQAVNDVLTDLSAEMLSQKHNFSSIS
jgi:ribosome-interacting GTPase 1